jgi:hypothetical protein
MVTHTHGAFWRENNGASVMDLETLNPGLSQSGAQLEKDKAALQISTVSMSFLALYYPTNLRQQFGSTADPNAREFGNDVQRRKGRSDLWLARIRVSESDDIRLRVSVLR